MATLDDLGKINNIQSSFKRHEDIERKSSFESRSEQYRERHHLYDNDDELKKAKEYLTKSGNTDFDDILDNLDDRINDMRTYNGLISLGRKYARSHDVEEGEDEILKAFAPQEAKLTELFDEVDNDCLAVEKDLKELRMMHTGRNYQRMTELISAKSQLHNTKLSILKEMSSIKKNIFDARNKSNANTMDTDASMMSSSIIQSVFGLDRGEILSAVDEFDESSIDPIEGSDSYGDIMYNQVHDTSMDDSDGAKFLKYENSDVKLVLQEDTYGNRNIFARDSNGNIISDYPLPANADSLTFEINKRTHSATDQLQRKYVYESI